MEEPLKPCGSWSDMGAQPASQLVEKDITLHLPPPPRLLVFLFMTLSSSSSSSAHNLIHNTVVVVPLSLAQIYL